MFQLFREDKQGNYSLKEMPLSQMVRYPLSLYHDKDIENMVEIAVFLNGWDITDYFFTANYAGRDPRILNLSECGEEWVKSL